MGSVKIGFIGCGHHATANLYPSLRFADCDLMAVSDLYEENRLRNKKWFGAENAYSDYREMLDNEQLDAVFISGTAEMHHDFSIDCMERGLHVYVEKPPARTLAGTIEMQQVSQQTGKYLVVGFMKRFGQKYQQAHEIMKSDDFGRASHFHIRYSHGMRADLKTCLLTMITHPIDLMRHFMGDITRVSVEMGNIAGTSNLNLQVMFTSGATGSLISHNTLPGVMERVEISGDGTFLVVDEVSRLQYYPRNEKIWTPPAQMVYQPNMALQTIDNNSLLAQGYIGEVQSFIEAVKNQIPPQIATIDDGVEAMRIVDLIEKNGNGCWEVMR